MGFTSVLVLNNDYLGDIEGKSLKEIWSETYAATTFHRPKSAAIEMVWNEHADTYCLMLIGNHHGKSLYSVFNPSRDEGNDKIELQLLKQLAEKHGYSLHKKIKTPKKG